MKSDLLNIVLQDDSSCNGGVAFNGETLKDFLDEMGLSYNTPLRKVNRALKECGIKKIKR